MYLNLVLGNQDGFRNLTSQIQNLTSDVELYREEIINKIEVRHCEAGKRTGRHSVGAMPWRCLFFIGSFVLF